MENIDFTNPIILLAIAAASFLVGKVLFKADTRVEERRRRAAEVSGKLRELGLTRLPDLLIDYSVGDYSGIFRGLKDLHTALHDPIQRKAEFGKLLKALLTEFMQDAEERPALVKLFDDLRTAHDPDTAAATAARAKKSR